MPEQLTDDEINAKMRAAFGWELKPWQLRMLREWVGPSQHGVTVEQGAPWAPPTNEEKAARVSAVMREYMLRDPVVIAIDEAAHFSGTEIRFAKLAGKVIQWGRIDISPRSPFLIEPEPQPTKAERAQERRRQLFPRSKY